MFFESISTLAACFHLLLRPGCVLLALVFAISAQETRPALPGTKALPPVPTNYVLRPNDEVQIRVFRNPELDGPRRISKDGTIDFPLLGIVSLTGKTSYEAASHLSALLDKDYLVRPQVFVNVVSTSKRFFNVLGEVSSPGTKEFPDDRDLDLLSAIAAAGGFTRLANQSRILVRRQGQREEETYKVDSRRLLNSKDVKPFLILPNDTIVVVERNF